MKHTKGEWKIEKVLDYDKTLVYAKIKTGNIPHAYTGVYHQGGRISNEECEANAKLITAAPDMLKALKEAQDELMKLAPNPLNPNNQIVLTAIGIMEIAIKKATPQC